MQINVSNFFVAQVVPERYAKFQNQLDVFFLLHIVAVFCFVLEPLLLRFFFYTLLSKVWKIIIEQLILEMFAICIQLSKETML